MKRTIIAGGLLLVAVGISLAQQSGISDVGGRILALETAWNHALEAKDTKALDMLLANTMVSVDIDGSIATKGDFLASIKAADYQPSQAVNEQSNVQVYGDAAVVVGIFRVKGNGKREAIRTPRTLRRHLGQNQWHMAMCRHYQRTHYNEAATSGLSRRSPRRGEIAGVHKNSLRENQVAEDVAERWLRGLDSNQDSRLQRPMCYQLHHPGVGATLVVYLRLRVSPKPGSSLTR